MLRCLKCKEKGAIQIGDIIWCQECGHIITEVSMISQIVARCHVGDDFGTVRRYVLSRFKRGAFAKLSRSVRRSVLTEIYKEHTANRKLYRQVMGGV